MDSKLIVASFGQNPETGEKIDPFVCRISPDDVDAAARKIKQLSEQPHRNVYMPLAIMRPDLPPGRKGSEDDIECVLGLCADFDDKNAHDWANRLPLPPDCVLQTSPGRFQCFNIFDCPLAPAEAMPLAEKLREYAGCDYGTADLSHVWRIPGTWNWPNKKKVGAGRSSEPQLVRVVQPWRETFTDPAKLALAVVEIKHTPGTPSLRKGEPVTADHLRELLSYIDPGCGRAEWIKIIAAIRNTNVVSDDDESQRRAIAHEWSEGRLYQYGH
jgi:hypothetical protein